MMVTTRSSFALKALSLMLLFLGLVSMAFTCGLYWLESRWDKPNQAKLTPAQAFINGSIGTELAPLAVFEVLPKLFEDEFHPLDRLRNQPNGTAGDWIDQYGFIRKSMVPKEMDDGTTLPVGFVVSYHRPNSGAPSPTPFVGLSCAACHSSEIRTASDKPGTLQYGVGNQTMNLLAFSEAIRKVLVKRKNPDDPKSEYALTLHSVETALGKERKLSVFERIIIWSWIRAARSETENYSQVIDDPLAPEQLFDPRWIAAGPIRTQPFRSLVRVHLNRPGMSSNAAQPDQGFSKIPVIYLQNHKYHGDWAQFDGSVKSLVARSTLAASTAGANVNNLSLPDLSSNIIRAAEYTSEAKPPSWKQVFGTDLDSEKLKAGEKIYLENCYRCHGGPDGSGGWEWTKYPTKGADYEWEWEKNPGPATRFGEVVSWKKIGTDPERVQFRHVPEIPKRVFNEFVTDFRKDHPLGTFKLDELRSSTGDKAGYYNGPIVGAFLRAPYLHNASVLTLAELIGLEPRRLKFYRGRNPFDVKRVGLESPEVVADSNGQNPKPLDNQYYFVFDTSVRGNSNSGHKFPTWAFPKNPDQALPREQILQLENLLEYLKSL